MFARVWLPVDRKSDVLVVPKDALVLGGPSPVVFVIDPETKESKAKARPVPVQLGIATESWIEVKGELKPGQQVVVEGNERLRPGGEVIGTPAGLKEPVKAADQKPKSLPDRFIEKGDRDES
jgi:multidrug efflux pump subunit AcrA (membrane-fusion protein)